MSNIKKYKKQDQSNTINLADDSKISYWLKTLACSYPDLSMAIITVGNSLPAIKAYLDKQANKKWRKFPTFNF